MKNYQNIKAIDRELILENGYFKGNMAFGDIRRYALSKAHNPKVVGSNPAAATNTVIQNR